MEAEMVRGNFQHLTVTEDIVLCSFHFSFWSGANADILDQEIMLEMDVKHIGNHKLKRAWVSVVGSHKCMVPRLRQ